MRRLVWALGTGLGLVVLFVATLGAFGLPVGASLRLLLEGAFGDKAGLATTLVTATPLLIAGLGITVAWRSGMYNIGGEGQYLMGALAGAFIAKSGSGLPPQALNILILAVGIVGGAIYAGFAGWLQVSRGVQVVISTILLNFIALEVLGYAITGPLQETRRQLFQTEPLPNDVMLMRFDPQTELHSGIFIALLACVGVYVLLFSTRLGFQLRIVGANPRAARAARMNEGGLQITAMCISGGLCGLAGAVQYTGIQQQLSRGFAEGWGFLAIPVALLGALHPFGVLLSALYFGALFAGAKNLERFTPGASAMVYVIQALAVLALVALQSAATRRQVHEESAA